MAQKLIKRKNNRKNYQAAPQGLASKLESVEKKWNRSDLPEYHTGDTVKVHVKIKEGEKERLQAFEGVVIARSNKGASKSFTVRKISHGVGVERIFLEASPKVAKLDVVSSGRTRRAKLYYLRGLEGKAAKLDRDVRSNEAAEASAAAKAGKN